jgi:hypothetical protein
VESVDTGGVETHPGIARRRIANVDRTPTFHGVAGVILVAGRTLARGNGKVSECVESTAPHVQLN